MKSVLRIIAVIVMFTMLLCYASAKHYDVEKCEVVEVVDNGNYSKVVIKNNGHLYGAFMGELFNFAVGDNATVIFYNNDVDIVEDNEIVAMW